MATHQQAQAPAPGDISKALSSVIGLLYDPIRDDLERVRQRYREELTHEDDYINNLLSYIQNYSGKMLRPALLLLAGKACGEVTEEHIILAVVAEMIHTATLVHDDILDDATTRRGRASINHMSGNEITVLLGDHLFSHALELALSIENPIGAHRFSRAVSRTCLGEICQVTNRGNLELTEDTYYRIVKGKTAELYATSAEIGAIYSGRQGKDSDAMYHYGMSLGVAFQIMDDILDLRGDEDTVGKTLGTDLANGKATLPVIHYLSQLSGADRDAGLALLRDGGNPKVRARIIAELNERGCIEYAETKAQEFVEDAKRSVEFLGDQPLAEFFRRLADFVATREL